MEPASGVVTVGERVQFNCTSSYPAHISHLYKKHSSSPAASRKVSDSERTVILTLADLVPEDSNEYCCSFEKTVNGKVYQSDRSAFVEVTVKGERHFNSRIYFPLFLQERIVISPRITLNSIKLVR